MTTTENEQRDELARTINGGLRNGVTVDDFRKQQLGNNSIGEYIAEAIRNLGYRKPRTITTVEELDALAEGSVIIDSDPTPCEKINGHWFMPGSEMRCGDAKVNFPATVLHEPEAKVGA